MPRILLAFALVTWLAACSSPPPALTGAMTAPSLLVTGDVERELRLDAAAFERLFAGEIGPVEHRTKQGTVTLRGLPLLPVIEAARPRYGDEQKHPEQCFAVLLRARDGYAVAFANEELRPDRDGHHRIRLAFAEEDGPLPDRFAPARLVIDDQGGNSRRIAGLTEIVVIDLRRAAADLEGEAAMSELRLEIRAAEAAGRIGAELQGDGERVLGRPAPLESASLGAFSFVDPARGDEPAATGATGVLFVSRPIAAAAATQIVTPDPRGAFFGLVRSALAERERSRPGGIAASARVHPEARIAADATIDELVVVGARSSVGPGSWLRPGTVVGEDCRIGSGVVIHANVSIRSGTVIGDRVTIHDGSVIGADGFGYEPGPTGLVKVPQIGVVVIEDEAEIGANVCIDRAALGETRIGRGSKIDNLVQIAHNVQVGPHAVIVAQVGISGSTRLGRGVMIGGQAGLVGHLAIGDGVRIGAQSGVGEDLAAGSEVLGSPAYDKRVALRSAMILPHLPAMRRQLRELDRRLDRLEDQSPDGRSRMP